MSFDRREFLKKMSISLGMVSLPGFGFGSGFYPVTSEQEFILHIGGKANKGVNTLKGNAASNRMILSTVSPVDFSNSGEFNSIETGDHAMLFGGEWLKKNGGLAIEDEVSEKLPFVNSNFTSKHKPASVSDYLVFKKSKRKIGVMGIGFGIDSQTLSDTIDTMNQVALYLKEDLGCDEVYCLADNPIPYFQYFSLKDLALASLHINQFFGTDTISDKNQLHVMQNEDQHEVLLTITSTKVETQPLISLREGRFSGVNLI